MITIENRPTSAGIYQMTYVLKNSNITLEKAQQIIKSKGAVKAVSADKNATIGLWKQLSAARPGQAYFGTKPLEPMSAYQTSFQVGAALAKIPPGYQYVQSIYSSYVLTANLQTPAGWTPAKTLIDQHGNALQETDRAGRVAQLATIPKAGIGQADILGLLNASEPDFFGYNGSQDLIYPANSDQMIETAPAFWGAAWKLIAPQLSRAIGFVGQVAIAFILARGLIYYLDRITFKKLGMIKADVLAALRAAQQTISESGAILLPALALGAGLLIYSIAEGA
jgi:hypothetical protein